MKETTIAAITPELDALAAESMAEWKVPGLAIAVVQNGKTALLKAYGQRDVEAGLPVTTRTQFTIGSITKTFAATGLAMLVDEGRLDLDQAGSRLPPGIPAARSDRHGPGHRARPALPSQRLAAS